MKMTRFTMTALAALSLSELAHAAERPTAPIPCEVASVVPDDPEFFTTAPGAPQAPQVGDRTTLDVNTATILDLAFESGRGIPLRRFGASMARLSPAATQFYDVFFTQHQGVLAYYEGVLTAQHGTGSSLVTVQVVKRARQPGDPVPYLLVMHCGR